jgi:hypothetical protein
VARAVVGAVASAPPPSVPLAFLAAAGVGFVGTGLAVAFAADRLVASPTHPGAVSAVHVGMLAFLTTAVLGALHQFGPVAGRRPLRSTVVARCTLVAMVAAAWLLPSGFAHGPEALVLVGGLLGATGVGLATWNLWPPLAARDGGVPVAGLRLAVAYLALTVSFGVVYAIDRQTGWFPLVPHRTLAHAHLGLLGWMGLAYVSVAEKLWPMFLLAHRPSARSGAWAVGLVAGGTAILSTGVLVAHRPTAVIGGVAVAAGLAAHLTSLAGCVRHRRRSLELLHAFLFASAAFLVLGAVLGTLGGLAPMAPATRSRILSAEVAALAAWLAVAVIGHAHKIVPFIAYTALRGRGVRRNRDGGPLLFADLFDARAARASLVGAVAGFASLVAGLLAGSVAAVSLAGTLLALTGAVTTANLVAGPWRAARVVDPAGPTATRAGEVAA